MMFAAESWDYLYKQKAKSFGFAHIYESVRTVLCVRMVSVNSYFSATRQEPMKFQIQTRAFSRFTFSFLKYSSKCFDATLQVLRLHVPPYTVRSLVPYVFIYTFISMFLHGDNKKLFLLMIRFWWFSSSLESVCPESTWNMAKILLFSIFLFGQLGRRYYKCLYNRWKSGAEGWGEQ